MFYKRSLSFGFAHRNPACISLLPVRSLKRNCAFKFESVVVMSTRAEARSDNNILSLLIHALMAVLQLMVY